MKKALDCKTNSPCQNLRKCLENSIESMHTDVWVRRVKSENPASHHSIPIPTLVHNSFLSLSLHGSVN